MDIILGITGLIIGAFLWASIWGSLFASIPVRKRLIDKGILKSMNWSQIIGSIVIASVLLFLSYVYVKPFFFGSLISSVFMLFSIPKLRREELEKHISAGSDKKVQ